MQTQIKFRKIINENQYSSEGLMLQLSNILEEMAKQVPGNARIHEIQIKKLDGNTIDHCVKDCEVRGFNQPTHVKACRKGQPNTERRFLVMALVSTGDEADGQDDTENDDDDDDD